LFFLSNFSDVEVGQKALLITNVKLSFILSLAEDTNTHNSFCSLWRMHAGI